MNTKRMVTYLTILAMVVMGVGIFCYVSYVRSEQPVTEGTFVERSIHKAEEELS